MIVLSILAESEHIGTGRAAGKIMKQRWGLAVDNYNLILAFQSQVNGPWIGKIFLLKLGHAPKYLTQFGLDIDNVTALIGQSLNHLFKKPQKRMTLEELDSCFKTTAMRKTERGVDSTGVKQFYIDVKQALGVIGDDEEEDDMPKKRGRQAIGDVIVEVPDFPGRAKPQTSFMFADDEDEED